MDFGLAAPHPKQNSEGLPDATTLVNSPSSCYSGWRQKKEHTIRICFLLPRETHTVHVPSGHSSPRRIAR